MRSKIDFGIDLGTTNSAIAVFENGDSHILKSKAYQKDTTPSCVSFRKSNSLDNKSVGDKAMVSYRSSLENKEPQLHKGLIEFKRDMGTDKLYNLGPDVSATPEELSSLVLMELKKNILNDETPSSVVITVPNAFKNNQIDATRKAGKLAGFEQVEIIHEPVAAAMFAAASGNNEDGYKLIFDFGGGTFDAAVLKLDEGIFSVIDSEGDPRLGGKDLDNAVVEKILLPKFINGEVDAPFQNICADKRKLDLLKRRLKPCAEELRITLSTEQDAEIDKEEFCEDDNGDPFDFFVEVSRDELSSALSPIYLKAVECSKALLRRCNLDASDLESIIMVGGPTLSPICREIISREICPPFTSIDPMTSVAKGAAIYASQRSIDESLESLNYSESDNEVKLIVKYETSSVEETELVTIKVDHNASNVTGSIKVTLKREGWLSDEYTIEDKGTLIEVELEPDTSNNFKVEVVNEQGSFMKAYPSTINIAHGTKLESSLLGWTWGIEVLEGHNKNFVALKGLEKNTPVPAKGVINGLVVLSDIRPGAQEDFIKIPLYQGSADATGARAIYQEHVYDAIITGEDLNEFLPAGAKVDLIMKVDASQKCSLELLINSQDTTHSWEVPENHRQSIDKEALKSLVREAKSQLSAVKSNEHTKSNSNIQRLQEVIENFSGKNIDDLEMDEQYQTQEEAKLALKQLDSILESSEWDELSDSITAILTEIKNSSEAKGNQRGIEIYNELKVSFEALNRERNVEKGKKLYEQAIEAFQAINRDDLIVAAIYNFNENFDSYEWKDRATAKALVSEAASLIGKVSPEDLGSKLVGIQNLLVRKPNANNIETDILGR